MAMKKTIVIASKTMKNGTTAQGKEWTRYGFFDNETWFNMWGDEWNADLQAANEGDTITIHFVKKEFKGKPQYEIINPTTPEVVADEKKAEEVKALRDAIIKINNRLEIVEAALDEIQDIPEDGI
jgi:hypothetical protein